MLSIREERVEPGAVVLRLDGRLRGEWTAELATQYMRHSNEGRTVTLDVNGVQFVDADGVALLRKLKRSGALIINQGLFLDMLLGETRCEGDSPRCRRSLP